MYVVLINLTPYISHSIKSLINYTLYQYFIAYLSILSIKHGVPIGLYNTYLHFNGSSYIYLQCHNNRVFICIFKSLIHTIITYTHSQFSLTPSISHSIKPLINYTLHQYIIACLSILSTKHEGLIGLYKTYLHFNNFSYIYLKFLGINTTGLYTTYLYFSNFNYIYLQFLNNRVLIYIFTSVMHTIITYIHRQILYKIITLILLKNGEQTS